MVAEAVQWVDVEGAVRAWARSVLDTELDGRVFFSARQEKTPQVVVQRLSGVDAACLFQFDVWAPTKAECAALAATLSTRLDQLNRYVYSGTLLLGADVTSVHWLPDPESGAPRFIVEATITAVATTLPETIPPTEPPTISAPAQQGDVMYSLEQTFTFDDFDLLGGFDALATFDDLLPAGAVVVGTEFDVLTGFVDGAATPGPGLIVTTDPDSTTGWSARGLDPDAGADVSVPGNFGSILGTLLTTFPAATPLYVRAISATSAVPFVAGSVKVSVYYFLSIVGVLEATLGFADFVESVDNPLGYVALFPEPLPDGARVTSMELELSEEFDADPLATPDYPTSAIFADYVDPVNGQGSGAAFVGPSLEVVKTARTLVSQSGDYPWARPSAPVMAVAYAESRPALTKGSITVRLFYRSE